MPTTDDTGCLTLDLARLREMANKSAGITYYDVHTLLDEIERLRKAEAEARAENEALRTRLTGARDALQSYRYGNASPELAEEMVVAINAAIAARQQEQPR